MANQSQQINCEYYCWEPYSDEGFIGLVGAFWTRTEGETPRFAFLAQPKHHNRRGVLQGGMMMTFARLKEELDRSKAIEAASRRVKDNRSEKQ